MLSSKPADRLARALLSLEGLSVGDAFGDRDTTCAMAGGIVALLAGAGSIPAAWTAAREALPRWQLQETSEI